MILMVVLVTTTSAQTLEGAPVPAPEKVATKARALMGTHPQLLLSQKRQAIAKKPSLRKTAKQLVSAETVPDTIIIVPESFEPEWYEETQDWYWGFMDQSMQYFVALDWYGTPKSPFGRVTFDMLDPDDSYIMGFETFEQATFEGGGFSVRQVKISNNLSAIKIAGELSGSDGNIYVLSGQIETLTPQDTIPVDIPNAFISLQDTTLLLNGSTETASVKAVINTTKRTAKHSNDEFDMEQVEVIVDGKTIDIWDIQANILANTTYTDLVADLTVLSKDTIVYAFRLTQPVAIEDTVSVAINNMKIDDSWGEYSMYFLYGSTKGFAIEAVTTNLTPGTYTMEKGTLISITLAVGGKIVGVLGGTLALEENLDGEKSADVECLAADNNLYRLHMCWAVPTPTKTVVFDFTERAVANINKDRDIFQMIGTNANASVAVGVQHWTPGRNMTITTESVLLDYTTVALFNGGDTIVNAVATVEGTIKVLKDTLWMNVEIICFDSVQYNVRMWYAVPTPTQTIDLGEITDTKFVNAMATMGVYQLVGATEDSTYTLAFCAEAPMDVEGEYENNGMFQSNLRAQYTWIKEKATGRYLNVMKAKVTVTMDQTTGDINANGYYVCDDEKQYNFTLKAKYERRHIVLDMKDTPLDLTFTSQTHTFTIDTEYLNEGTVLFEAMGKNNADYLILQFLLDSAQIDPQTAIYPGEYSIDDSYVAGTVTAGDFNGTSIYPSFFGKISSQGISTKGLYFLVEGTVMVEKLNEHDLHIVLEAINSYEVPVKIDINTATTDIHHAEAQHAETRKFLKNGQVFIQRGENIYSVLGNAVKQ